MVSGRNGKGVYLVATAALFVAIAILLVYTNMSKGQSHDEHMYIAGGSLLAHGLVPYRDFHYFQMPYLAFAYAAVFGLTSNLLLAARLFNTMCAILSLCVVYHLASVPFREQGYPIRFLAGASAVALALANPIFIYTSGLAWNHDLPVLLTLLALALFSSHADRHRPAWWLLAAGALLGCAVGTRLSFALAVPPFAVAALLLPGAAGWYARFRALLAFGAGLVLALIPALLLFALSPAGFLFDNLRYHALNELYWQTLAYTRAMDLPGKLQYAKDVALEPATLLLVAAFILLVPLAIRATRTARSTLFTLLLASSLVPFLLIGALVPTPTWYQYFYTTVPLMALAVAHAVAALYSPVAPRLWAMALYSAVAIVCLAFALPSYANLIIGPSPDRWVPIQVHQVGEEIRRIAGEGRLLTLAPLFPLEGGLDVYLELAAGPFGWRINPFLPDAEKRALHLASAGDLNNLLRTTPPRAILTGLEPGLEDPLKAYARAHSFVPHPLSNGATLWLPPQ